MRILCFTVERLEFVGSEKFMIAGRNCQDELRRGDRLRVYNEIEQESSIEFCVDEIMWYGRTVEAVGHGHTAGLFFFNELAGYVGLGDMLRGQSNS